jgi:hypothetical protein
MGHLPSHRSAIVSLLLLSGCGSESGTTGVSQGPLPPGYVPPPSTENLPLVDNPEFASWNRFPVGIAVVRKKEVSNDSGSVRVTTTLRLVEKKRDKVVVESQVTVDRPGEPVVENPSQKLEFAAAFQLPQGMKPEQFALPSLKAKVVGNETRMACGREYQTELYSWDERNEAGPMTIKLWRSEEIPGRMLRQEVKGRTQVSVEEVVEIIQPDV